MSSKLDENKILTADTWNYNVNIFLNKNEKNQEWLFKYHPSKDAYTIASVYDPRIVLALNVLGDPENVVVSSFAGNIIEQFWKLEQNPDGYFIIKSAKNENLVIDIQRNDPSNENNIKVYQRKYSNNSNQKFKFSK
ncbi:RICIN domain-containing protein [Clostridium perfringens]|uniref:RICIN domain-containing protein n=1 Tax=Clostridium perfringens TaxID=1502 RepID=UPI0028CC1BE1|nr:RICIN domain-containing protein [Clostridium perfringens]MDT7914746.1 RICIN domain-containing protein [Clostridium perfringens]MDT7918822.1 RICIN domain-containing protein [Clostridium perfringens]MDT7938389.1 RICIN domain-containing protein [Clostridium perfringens]MDT7941540.1 RICIN domain-containing protein [Clostridium perfringens]MDT7967532.1 RICIN domain-containing protein [Clostridium perfringens]